MAKRFGETSPQIYARIGGALCLILIAVEALNKLNLLAALHLAEGASALAALEPAQLHALASLALRLFASGFAVSLVFFGCLCLVLGHLVRTAHYFPVWIGLLLQVAGVCYLLNSFSFLLAPAFAAALFPLILVPAFVAELSFALWLLLKGVDLAEWNLRTRMAQRAEVTAA